MTQLGRCKRTVEDLERTLADVAKIVHPNHYLAMQIKKMLMLMYGNCPSHRLAAMSRKDLERKAELCRNYMEIFNKLEPGRERIFHKEIREKLEKQNK